VKRTCKRKAEGFLQESGLGSLQAPAGGLRPRFERPSAGCCESGKELAGERGTTTGPREDMPVPGAVPAPPGRNPVGYRDRAGTGHPVTFGMTVQRGKKRPGG